jgi:hypothetical protein
MLLLEQEPLRINPRKMLVLLQQEPLQINLRKMLVLLEQEHLSSPSPTGMDSSNNNGLDESSTLTPVQLDLALAGHHDHTNARQEVMLLSKWKKNLATRRQKIGKLSVLRHPRPNWWP